MDHQNKTLVFTDGACKGNPGPMGIGILIIPDINKPLECTKIGRYIGEGTNNKAELTAIKTALEMLKDHNKSIILYTDSQYCINILTKSWKANANVELINEIKRMIINYKPGIHLMYIEAHKNNVFNNMVDKLASDAARLKRNSNGL